MLHSLLVNQKGERVWIDYLHGDDTSARGRRRLAGMVGELGGEIAYRPVPDQAVAGLPIKGFTRKATWYRILLDKLLPDAERVIWLDSDLLVMDSLVGLWRTPLDGKLLGAVTNVPPGPERYVDRPELGGDAYFNAGVLLVDVAGMRSERTSEQLTAFGRANASSLALRDQDALNYVLHDRRLSLHPRWNCTNSIVLFDYASEYFGEQELEEARRNPAIRHFEGPADNKPWHLLAEPERRAQYAAHRRQTPWPRVRPEGCTPPNLLRSIRRRLV